VLVWVLTLHLAPVHLEIYSWDTVLGAVISACAGFLQVLPKPTDELLCSCYWNPVWTCVLHSNPKLL